MATIESLRYLASRLGRIRDPECEAAHTVVLAAIEAFHMIDRSMVAEHDLFHDVWGHLSRALDYCVYPPDDRDELDALEAEMAGRVLVLRLKLGWIQGRPEKPQTEERGVMAFIGKLRTRLL